MPVRQPSAAVSRLRRRADPAERLPAGGLAHVFDAYLQLEHKYDKLGYWRSTVLRGCREGLTADGAPVRVLACLRDPGRQRQLLSELLDSLRPWSSEIHMVLLDSRYRLDPR
jgi:hypothetical protein